MSHRWGNRRTTLGAISTNAFGGGGGGGFVGRASVDPATMKAMGGGRVYNPRRSTSAASAGRKSSVGLTRRSSVFSKGQPKDPRPLKSKPYIKDCIETVGRYLSEHGYDQPMSFKILSSPTGKDFLHIVTFLLRQLDPAFSFRNRMEDELPLIFKAIGCVQAASSSSQTIISSIATFSNFDLSYPFPISKTGLTAVGSPHTWPALLAALRWVAELLYVRLPPCQAPAA